MAVGRHVVTATTTVPAGTAATVVAGEPGTGGAAGYGSAATTGGPLWPTTYQQGQVIMVDSSSALYTSLAGQPAGLGRRHRHRRPAGHSQLSREVPPWP